MIRDATWEDLEFCRKTVNHYIEHSDANFAYTPYTKEAYEAMAEGILGRYPWIIDDEEGEPAGFCYLSPFNEKEGYSITADLTIYLNPAFTSRGIGSKLMEEILARAEGKYHTIVSLITIGNTPSEHLHEKFGFIKAMELSEAGIKNGSYIGVSYYIRRIES